MFVVIVTHFQHCVLKRFFYFRLFIECFTIML